MRGKKPKERERYVLRMGDGSLVEVSREVYLEWYQSRRREKYQIERNLKYGVCSLDVIEENGGFLKKDGHMRNEPEEDTLKKLCMEMLQEGLKSLSEQDAYLIHLLFFEEITIKDAAQICGCSRKTIQNRRKRILEQLREIMGEMGIAGGCF
ncbi:sigma-70 family RNA polymerase sigma factor [Lacrimispora xylanisolvens]|uniref:sigma-70 family RNA polymerase sigma factor n=1 Tax=Lacrimispora xylanisolvens TaxID=384636 RepID=UPI00240280EB